VWAVGHARPPYEGRLLAAVKAGGPGAVLSHWSATELWEFLDPVEREPHITVPGGSSRRAPGVRIHRSSMLEPGDVTVHRGVPVTSAAWTLLDLAAVAGERTLRIAVRTAQGRRRVAIVQLLELLDRVAPRAGTRRLMKVIASGPAPILSVLEDRVLELLLEAGIAHPDVNKPLAIGRRRVIPDFRWPDQRLIVEVDGRAWHDGRLAREADAERQAFLEAHGERVIRVTWEQSVTRRPETIRRVLAAGAPLAADRRLSSPMRKKVDTR